MFRAFQACDRALVPDGRMVVVFANKNPDAWETLVSAIIRAGFVVDAKLADSDRDGQSHACAVIRGARLVCLARMPQAARDRATRMGQSRARRDAREHPHQLREYWDAGIRGPDFVWAATGPALEAYSKHPVVKKANEPGASWRYRSSCAPSAASWSISSSAACSPTTAMHGYSGLDDVTTYYLLHRHDFGMDDAPIGACILYAISCGLSDHDLADRYEILQTTGGQAEPKMKERRTRRRGR